MNASVHCVHMLDTVYHGDSLGFITNCTALTHHCILYAKVNRPALSTRLRLSRVCVNKAILGSLHCYLSVFLSPQNRALLGYGSYDVTQPLMTVQKTRTE